MKIFKLNSLVVLLAIVTMSSCTYRLVDFTVISTKNAEIGVDRTKGKPTEGSKAYFLGFGWNIKDAADEALEVAGPKYDLLLDGVVTYSSFPFVAVVKVKGVAVCSQELRAELGNEGFKKWANNSNVFDADEAETQSK